VTFRWQLDQFATQYRLIVSELNGSRVIDKAYGTNICSGDTCAIALALENGVYTWQIESSNEIGAARTGAISFARALVRLEGLALGGQVLGT